MDDFAGYVYSWAGFVDYSNCYHKVDVLWIITGACITVGTVISIIPQLYNIVKNKSSYGLNSFTLTATSLGQYVNVLNYYSLHAADFIGVISIPIGQWLPRLLSFINIFSLWYMYVGNTFLNAIFFDKKPREHRNEQQIRSNKKVTIGFTLGLHVICITLSVLYIVFGATDSFFGDVIMKYGYILGLTGGIIAIAQYAPQMYTTCKLESPGSLSLILLAIQAPGGTINSMFLAIGNQDNWTTWFPLIMGAIQQFILLFICIYFVCKARKRRLAEVEAMDTKPLISEGVSSISLKSTPENIIFSTTTDQ